MYNLHLITLETKGLSLREVNPCGNLELRGQQDQENSIECSEYSITLSLNKPVMLDFRQVNNRRLRSVGD